MLDGAGSVIGSVSAKGNPWTFTGRRLDSETGLMYYRARMYSTELGKFISRDPIGYEGGINLFEYVFGEPTGLVDPIGLEGYGPGTIITGNPRSGIATGPGGVWWTNPLGLVGKTVTYVDFKEYKQNFKTITSSISETTGPTEQYECTPCDPKTCTRTCSRYYLYITRVTNTSSRAQEFEYGVLNMTRANYYEFVNGAPGQVVEAGVPQGTAQAYKALHGSSGWAKSSAGRIAAAGRNANLLAATFTLAFMITSAASEDWMKRDVLGTGWDIISESSTSTETGRRDFLESWKEKCKP